MFLKVCSFEKYEIPGVLPSKTQMKNNIETNLKDYMSMWTGFLLYFRARNSGWLL
jgi:hypothetical protein